MLQMRGASMMKYLRRHNPRRRATAIGIALTAGYAGRYLLCRATGDPVGPGSTRPTSPASGAAPPTSADPLPGSAPASRPDLATSAGSVPS
jgi:hypothetical protein